MKQRTTVNNLNALLAIKQTQIELCEVRKYKVSDKEKKAVQSKKNFFSYMDTLSTNNPGVPLRALLNKKYTKKRDDGPDEQLMVFYAVKTQDQKQISGAAIRPFINAVKDGSISEAILVLEASLSSAANNEINAIKLTKIQLFNDIDLAFNPLHHVDVPVHEYIPPEEAKVLLKAMKTTLNKLNVMRITEPVAKMYGFQVGSLIRIHRVDDVINILNTNSINYRVVAG